MKRLICAALLCLSAPAYGQVAISALPSATTPLAGTEIVPIVQGGVTKNVSVANIQKSGTQTANTVLAGPSGSSGAPSFRALVAGDLPVPVFTAVIDMTGATDVSTSLQTQLNAHPNDIVRLPAGTPELLAPVTLNTGQVLECSGRTQTVFQIPATFTPLSAAGVITMGAAEPGGTIRNCGFNFIQPTSLTRGSVVQYPPAIYAPYPRWVIDNVRVQNAWRCLDARGNAGGATLVRMECGAFANDSVGGIAFDGALDFVHIGSIECWPFGMTGAQLTVYEDQSTLCASFGRIDGLAVNQLASFTASVAMTANAANTAVPYAFNTMQLDGDGAQFTAAAGNATIGNYYSTKDSSSINTNGVALISGGNITISNANLNNADIQGPAIAVTGGALTILGGTLNQQAVGQPMLTVSGTGTAAVYNVNSAFPVGSIRTVPYYLQSTGGALILENNIAVAQSGSTAAFAGFATDVVGNYVSNNYFPGWAHTNFTTAVGYYSYNEPEVISFTPTFQTVGNFAPTVTSSVGKATRKGDYLNLFADVTFTTNAYTTASGAFLLTNTQVPPPIETAVPCVLSQADNVTATTFNVQLQSNTFVFPLMVSGAATTDLGTGQVPASKTGVHFRFSCTYRIK